MKYELKQTQEIIDLSGHILSYAKRVKAIIKTTIIKCINTTVAKEEIIRMGYG